MNNFYKPTDSKREIFRKYLERAGVMDVITKAFTNLYEEENRPEDPLEYVINAMGGVIVKRDSDIPNVQVGSAYKNPEIIEQKSGF
ncbi:c-Myc-binding protein-like [Ctenocephalides felis]|uniref:c-Myc-binding protein-like n=1 Tax=Ctenocephalides felis TaxID=7515 RepID=UPI000E6E3F13|nr:c-Myc-binding protein-like [Ctenocephalides felis]